MSYLEFKNPWALLLLVPYALMIFWYLYGKVYKGGSAVAVSSKSLVNQNKSFRALTYPYVPILRFIAILLIIVAISRPGKGIDYSTVKNLGIDIMIALDVSGSMGQQDFEPKNRLHVAKKVIADFIKNRESDRIGLVIFGADAYLQCPLTVEHDMITDIVTQLSLKDIDGRRTAVGDGLALAASRMLDSKSKSKVILLLTDGASNAGTIDPLLASSTCKDNNIKVYSIGIGKKYTVLRGPFGITQRRKSDLDIDTLKKIAEDTKGKFFHATSSGVLKKNFQEIDMMEKSSIDLKIYHEFYDKFEIFLFIAMGLFFTEIFLRSIVYRKIP